LSEKIYTEEEAARLLDGGMTSEKPALGEEPSAD